MKFISNTILFTVLLVISAACSKENRHGANSQDEAPDSDTSILDQNDIVRDKPVPANHQSTGDNDFVIKAADGGLLEVQLAQLAKQKGTTKPVKDFAQTMIVDHGKANNELKMLAGKLNIAIPDSLSEKSLQVHNHLAQKKGVDFDIAYIKMMVSEHQQTIVKFREASGTLQSQELRDWVAGKIPTLEHHLTMAQKMNTTQN